MYDVHNICLRNSNSQREANQSFTRITITSALSKEATGLPNDFINVIR